MKLNQQTNGVINVPVKFRWPIEQIGNNEVIVRIPTNPTAIPLIQLSSEACVVLKLSDKEQDKVREVAQEAALRSILIIE